MKTTFTCVTVIIVVSLGVLVGCSEERKSELADRARLAQGVPFPHPEGWDQEDAHGLTAIKVGKDKCAICHGEDFLGGISNISCLGCHSLYPHKTGWADPTSHGSYVLTEFTAVTSAISYCALCHGEDFQGGDTKVSCFACHPFPHPPSGWVTGGTSHGLYLQSRNFNVALCSNCHGQDFAGGDVKVSCTSCHSTYPHPEPQWAQRGSGAFHGDTVNAQGGPSSCGYCHGSDYQGGNSLVSCYSCHSLYPHTANWGSVTHAGYVTANGDSSCRGCHQDLKSTYSLSPIQFPNCQFCHQ